MIIIRLKKNVLVGTWMSKDFRLFTRDLGNILTYLTFTENGGCLSFSHSCEKEWCWLIKRSVAYELILLSLPANAILDNTRMTSCGFAHNDITKASILPHFRNSSSNANRQIKLDRFEARVQLCGRFTILAKVRIRKYDIMALKTS